MSKKFILLTGATGFLGSEIAKELLNNNYTVVATKRTFSDLWRCRGFEDKIIWIDIDLYNWEKKVIKFPIFSMIHTSWSGVSAKDRENYDLQNENLHFLESLLGIAKILNCKSFIGFGSQAEYGNFSGIVDETHPINPNSAYAYSKIKSCNMIQDFCNHNFIHWNWFRLFSFFGELENENWLIPTLISSIKSESTMNMTPGEQRYAYMYVKDLSKLIVSLLNRFIPLGIYNISSNYSISLIELTEKIIQLVNPNFSGIKFGALPYRENQSMLIQGSNLKIESILGHKINETDFEIALRNVVNYNLNKN